MKWALTDHFTIENLPFWPSHSKLASSFFPVVRTTCVLFWNTINYRRTKGSLSGALGLVRVPIIRSMTTPGYSFWNHVCSRPCKPRSYRIKGHKKWPVLHLPMQFDEMHTTAHPSNHISQVESESISLTQELNPSGLWFISYQECRLWSAYIEQVSESSGELTTRKSHVQPISYCITIWTDLPGGKLLSTAELTHGMSKPCAKHLKTQLVFLFFQGECLVSPLWFDRGVYFIIYPLESIHVLLLKLYAM